MWPVGAVSMTTNRSSPCATVSAKARKTAISSVHGLRRSSSSSARPCASRPLAGRREHLLGVAPGLERRIDARHAQLDVPASSPSRLLDVGGRIGGRQRDREAAPGELASRCARRRSSCRRRPCPSSSRRPCRAPRAASTSASRRSPRKALSRRWRRPSVAERSVSVPMLAERVDADEPERTAAERRPGASPRRRCGQRLERRSPASLHGDAPWRRSHPARGTRR